MKDYYGILGVSEQAAEKDIKAAYRKLAKLYHPDVVKDDADKTQRMYEIQEAYQCLGDEESRKKYDRARMERRAGGQQTGNKRSEKNEQREDATRGTLLRERLSLRHGVRCVHRRYQQSIYRLCIV